MMLWVIVATLPGVLALTYLFGANVLTNLVIASLTAWCIEAAIAKLKQQSIRQKLMDHSGWLTAILLVLAVPPSLSPGLIVLGVCFALFVGKHVFGGLGQNVFNPAMVGYVFLLISFPVDMTLWPAIGSQPDIITMATPLDDLKSAFNQQQTVSTIVSDGDVFACYPWLGCYLANHWWLVNAAFLLGGLLLLFKKIITWHIPITVIASMLLLSSVLFWLQPDYYVSPLFHLSSGGLMLGAFFIATDPVTAATSRVGQLVYGMAIGVLIYVIRTWGSYPDAVAFAVLLMNLAAPTIDKFTKPRVFGY